ncbi:MAG TPA: penicillin acylase family protein [Chitinophagaceae bacterium]|nr:penicillin acylase family protein [Chitinophagaceae bacterium]
MRLLYYFLIILHAACSSSNRKEEDKRYKELAQRVTIIRDIWGIPHIYGKTDADVVFGLMYAQCEESFERVEKNYLQVMGRMAEVHGAAYLYQDLQMKIIYDTAAAIADYQKAPAWLKKLLHAFADGINYYLYKHPEVKPLVLTHFEPWFPLLFTDGAYISTNTGGLETEDIKNFYGKNIPVSQINKRTIVNSESTGSNAFAIAPLNTESGNALLYINPHVSFYFRTEVHLVSEEASPDDPVGRGLNAYGAATWGQFFIFQGFNQNCGWMHTSSKADAADLYEEKIIQKGKDFFYEYDGALKPVSEKKIFISYKKNGKMLTDSVNIYYTHHGPVLGSRNARPDDPVGRGKWLSLKEQNRSMNSLIQSWQRMKAKNFREFKNTMQIKANASTNTMYADDKGNIAYWHGNFIPKRDAAYNWSLPVDGTVSATEWKGVHEPDEIVHIENPVQGWIQNCNSTPFNISGFNTINKKSYPAYMAPEGENFRSLRAIGEIEREKKFTIEKLMAVGYDHYLSIFDSLLPALFKAFDTLPVTDPLYSGLKEPVSMLRSWDKRSSITSVPTTLTVFWTYQIVSADGVDGDQTTNDQVSFIRAIVKNTSAKQKLEFLYNIISGLHNMYGSWKIPWGDINRYQRTTGTNYPKFDDNDQSFPVGMAPAYFGSLPAYETVWQNTQKQYGVAGNSFVAVVEFGEKIKAKSIVAGGQSFDPRSKHFLDQATMFTEGKFKDVFFYKEDVEKNAESNYHPGEEK